MSEYIRESIEKKFGVSSDLIYHYCSMDVFKSIIENKELWLCDARCSRNDDIELEYIVDVAKEMKEDGSIDEKKYNAIKQFFGNLQAYIVCFSKDGDLSTQWEEYGDNGKGVSIGFNKTVMSHLVDDKIINTVLADVQYIEENKEKDIREKIKKFDLDEHFFDQFLYGLGQRAWKAKKFESEMEVRLIYTPKVKTTTSGYEVDCSGLSTKGKDYFPLKFLENPADIINRIIIGPKNNISVNEVKCALAAAGFCETVIDVEKAITPYPD